MPRRRFELLRAFAHHPLKMACLPIPPPRHLAGVGGLEPPTCGFGDRCSNQLSYTPSFAPSAAFLTSKLYCNFLFGSGCQPPDQLRGNYTGNSRIIQCSYPFSTSVTHHPSPVFTVIARSTATKQSRGWWRNNEIARPDLSGLAMTDWLFPTHPP